VRVDLLDRFAALVGAADTPVPLFDAALAYSAALQDGDVWPGAAARRAELEEAVQSGDKKHIEEEIGDLFFSVVNLARKLGIESESALAAANDKFVRRFHAMEKKLHEQGKELGKLSLAEMDEAWDAVKHQPGI